MGRHNGASSNRTFMELKHNPVTEGQRKDMF